MWLLTSSLSAQVSADSSLGLKRPSRDPGFYAMSRGTHSQRPSSWRGWRTRPYVQPLYGAATLLTSTGLRSLIKSIASPPDSPASPFQSPAEWRESTTSASYGTTLPPASIWFDPPSSSWRTSQASLWGGYPTYSLPWPKKGMMRAGLVYELPLPPTTGSASSYWPTPSARDFRSGKASQDTMAHNARPLNEYVCSRLDLTISKAGGNFSDPNLRLNPLFVEMLMGWPKGWTGSGPVGMELYHFRLRELLLHFTERSHP